MTTKARATIRDLYALPDNQKAELVAGERVPMYPTGDAPGYAADEIFVSLRQHSKAAGDGRAFADNKGFIVKLPNRGYFSPDAAYYIGPHSGGDFLRGAPIFAVEVRSKGDYGPRGRLGCRCAKEELIRAYRHNSPDAPTLYRRREIAEAEPAVPGWTMPVDDLFY